MQLNNINNHSIITIQKIFIYENKIKYNLFEKNSGILLEQNVVTPENLILEEELDKTVNITQVCYNELVQILDDFIISENLLNWKMQEYPIRIILPIKLLNKSLTSMDSLGQIISSKISQNAVSETKFVFDEQNIVVAYFNQVTQEDGVVLQPYIDSGEIIVETIS